MSANKSKSPPNPAVDNAENESIPELSDNTSGRVKFDDRGNAIWEWSITTGAFGREVSTERLKRLENPALSIAEDAPTPFDIARPNPLGTVKGYDPYDSGKLGKAAAARKKDLRRLSEFLKLKKQHAGNKDGEE
ncbi:MAG TPA: hypothetical protein VGO37_14210 [Steroidobacteraceae bacterium]|nr:hypothetical protein [Steroidobacteraceae bacterium]